MGMQNLKPRFLESPDGQKTLTCIIRSRQNTQCWVRIYNQPVEYRDMINLLNIARGLVCH